MSVSNPPTRAPAIVEARDPHASDTAAWTFCRVRPSALGDRVRPTVRRVLKNSGVSKRSHGCCPDAHTEDVVDTVLSALDSAWGAPGTKEKFHQSVPEHLETCLHDEEWGFWAVLEDDALAQTPAVRQSGLQHHIDELSLVSRLVMEKITGVSADGFYNVTVGAFIEPGTDPATVNRAIAQSPRLTN